MPRPLGILIITATSFLVGVYGYFVLVWLLSIGAKLIDARLLGIAMFIVAPHMAGWLVALMFAAIAFVLSLRLARKRHIAWLGFPADVASNGTPGGETSAPPR